MKKFWIGFLAIIWVVISYISATHLLNPLKDFTDFSITKVLNQSGVVLYDEEISALGQNNYIQSSTGWINLVTDNRDNTVLLDKNLLAIDGEITASQGYFSERYSANSQINIPGNTFQLKKLWVFFGKTWFDCKLLPQPKNEKIVETSNFQNLQYHSSISLNWEVILKNIQYIHAGKNVNLAIFLHFFGVLSDFASFISGNPELISLGIIGIIIFSGFIFLILKYQEFFLRNYWSSTFILGIGLFAVGLFYIPTSNYYFLYDEYYSWLTINQSWWEMVVSTAGDVHPPLYYFFLKFVGLFVGENILFLKVAHLFLIFPFVFILSKLYKLIFPWKYKIYCLLTLVFLCVNIYFVIFMGVIRMYSIGIILYLSSCYFLVKLLKNPNGIFSDKWTILCYALFAIFGLYLHNYFIFLLFAHCIFFLGYLFFIRVGKKEYIKVFLLYTGIWLIYLPWFFVLLKQSGSVSSNYWILPFQIGNIANLIADFLLYIYNEYQGVHLIFQSGSILSILVVITYSFLFIKFIYESQKEDRFGAVFTQFVLIVPILVASLYSIYRTPIFAERYFFFLLPFFLLPFLNLKKLYLLALFFITVPLFFWHYQTVQYLDPMKYSEGFDEKIEYIIDLYQPDLILHTSSDSLFRSQYFLSVHPEKSFTKNAIYLDTPENKENTSYNGASLFHNFVMLHATELWELSTKKIVVLKNWSLTNSLMDADIPSAWILYKRDFYNGLYFNVYKNNLDSP